jgi:hypothetical protein
LHPCSLNTTYEETMTVGRQPRPGGPARATLPPRLPANATLHQVVTQALHSGLPVTHLRARHEEPSAHPPEHCRP